MINYCSQVYILVFTTTSQNCSSRIICVFTCYEVSEEGITMCTSSEYEYEFGRFLYNSAVILDNKVPTEYSWALLILVNALIILYNFHGMATVLNFILSQIVQDYGRIIPDSGEISILVCTNVQPSWFSGNQKVFQCFKLCLKWISLQDINWKVGKDVFKYS